MISSAQMMAGMAGEELPEDFSDSVKLTGNYQTLTGEYCDGIFKYNGSDVLSDVDGVTGTIIVSDAATAIIVDDGNAYLYDTLQDSVNVVSKRADGDGKVNIQLLKQPNDTSVTIPENVKAGNITITKLDESTNVDFDSVKMTDANGNKVAVKEDGTLNTTIAVTDVTLDKTSLNLYMGNSEMLTATVLPEDADNRSVTWSSSAPDVATVENGLVTAVGNGTTTIKATAGGASAECAVTVTAYIPPVTDPSYAISVPATDSGTVTVSPAAAKEGNTVTITVTPDTGYQVGTVTVTDRNGDSVNVTANTNGTYSFVMPAGQVTVSATFTESRLSFSNVDSEDWFYEAIKYVYDNGLMNGVDGGKFDPNGTTTRARITVIADGYDNGNFGPDDAITREQMAAMLYRYADYMGYDVSGTADLDQFPDGEDTSVWAEGTMSWAVAEGLISGGDENVLQPGGSAIRAQAATILVRFCENIAQ